MIYIDPTTSYEAAERERSSRVMALALAELRHNAVAQRNAWQREGLTQTDWIDQACDALAFQVFLDSAKAA